MADSDPSLIRKRPRLTLRHGCDGSESPGHTVESPLVVEIIEPDNHDDPAPDVITIEDDDIFDPGDVASFPWATDQRSPEQTAAQFAALCCEVHDKEIPPRNVEEFGRWFYSHVASLSAAQDTRSFAENHNFWAHVGRCLEGLATRR